jgi:XTP/dITP diphosphohydrolase
MKDITDRQAFFVCCMTLIIDDYRIYTVQETMEGTIIDEETGTGGFGYDPVFYLPALGKTVAQLSSDEKNNISHRGKAGSGIEGLLQHIETQ